MLFNIKEGIINRAQKVVIYGPAGIGKTTLGSLAPEPLIIDTEGGTAHLDVKRIDQLKDYEELLAIIKGVAATPGICKTLVIDTADWAEQMIIAYLCNRDGQKSIESYAYGRGYTYMGEEFSRLLAACDQVIDAGIHVIIIAHAKMRKFEQPDEMGAYDRWELKLSRQVAPLLKEWADHLLFCNYQTFVVTGENHVRKAQGGKRVIYTTHHPAWDAKTRSDLPEVIDLDYRNIAQIFAGHEPAAGGKKKDEIQMDKTSADTEGSHPAANDSGTPLDRLRRYMEEAGITETEIRKFVADKGHYAVETPIAAYSERFITGWCLKYWDRIVKAIKTLPDAAS